MKQLILTIVIAAASNTLHAQCKEKQIIRTNPSDPDNTELISKIPSGGVNEQLNTFDWGKWRGTTNKTFDLIELNPSMGWHQNGQSIPMNSPPTAWQMLSPFGFTMMTYYPYMLQGGPDPEDKDWRWEDGWELMWLHTGYYPNGMADMYTSNSNRINASASTLANKSTPYIALYNRYTGKLRFFGNYKFSFGTLSTNTIQVRLAYTRDTNASGIFRHGYSYDQALDQKTKITELSSLNNHPGSTNSWMVSDFQLGYDPCVCSYESVFSREYIEVRSADIHLESKSVNFENQHIGALPQDFLNTIAWNNPKYSNLGSGNFTYKFMGKLNADYAVSLKTYEARLAAYNKSLNQSARELIEISREIAGKGVLNPLNLSEGATNMVKDYMKNLGGVDISNEEELVKGVLKTANAILSKEFDFLSKQNISQNQYNQPLKPTMPNVSFSQSITKGMIENVTNLQLGSGFTPGSFDPLIHNVSSFNYPIYNKPTGLYALLKTPQIFFGNYVGAVRDKKVILVPKSIGSEGWTSKHFVAYTEHERILNKSQVYAKHLVSQDITFQLNEQLLYKLNRNLDINDQKSRVLVSFQIELEGNLPRLFHDHNTILNERRLEVDLSESNFQILYHEPYINRNHREKIILEIPWSPIENTFKSLYGGRVKLIANYYVGALIEKEIVRNPIVPIVPNYRAKKSELITRANGLVTFDEDTKQIQLLSKSAQVATTIKSIKMKVLTDLTFDQVSSKGGEINTAQVFTYLLYHKDHNIDLIGSNGKWLNGTETESLAQSLAIPALLTLTNDTIGPNSPYVSFVEGNQLWIRAHEIHIAGSVTVMPGYKAVFLLSDQGPGLKELPGSTLDPHIQTQFSDAYLRFPSKPITFEASREQVNAFCSNSNAYKAHIQDSEFIADKDSNGFAKPIPDMDDIDPNLIPIPNNAILFPNPNNGEFSLQFERPLNDEAKLHISDINGRILHKAALKKGQETFQISANNLANRIYFVSIIQKQYKTTHKMTLYKP